MTKRTFGFLATLSILSIALFTAAMVLAYPSPNDTASEKQLISDTESIDKSRSIANTDSARQAASSTNQQATSQNSSDSSPDQVAQGADTTSASTNPPSAQQTTTTTTSSPTTQKQPAASAPERQVPPAQAQPTLMTFVRDTVNNIVTLLPV